MSRTRSASLPRQSPAGDTSRERLAWYAGVAHLAPSKHNTQPWRFVVRDGCLDVWADPMRLLPATDPGRRELTLSCGAAVHLACVAARAAGRRPVVDVLPDGPGGAVARVREGGDWLTTDDDRAALAAAFRRRTDRGPLDGDVLAPELPFQLQSEAAQQGASLRLVRAPGERATLAALVAQADRRLAQRGQVNEELAAWTRVPEDTRADGVPADHTRGPASSYRSEFVERDFSLPGVAALQDRDAVDRPLVAVLCSSSDAGADWLTAGRALAAVLVRATRAGANASYLNQPVEDGPSRSLLAEQLVCQGHPQVVLRIGAGDPDIVPPPRRSLDEVLFFD